MKYRLRNNKVTLLTILLVGILSGVVITSVTRPIAPLQPLQAFAADTRAPAVDSSAQAIQLQFSSAVKQALPAVVSIRSSRVIKIQNQMPMDPFFHRFFGDIFPDAPQAPEQREQGLGSGVVISSDGLVVTNYHVVNEAQDIKVVLSDETEHKATLVGGDPRTDLALLKVDAANLPVLHIETSSEPDVGDIVFAIGNPFGVGQTVTMGIVSAKGRGNLGIEDYEDFIQTDAAINPGNSGGALINLRGSLVGINTAIIGRSGGNDGIGFAIPSQMVRHVVDQIRTDGKVTRGYLGAYIQEVTPDISSAFQLNGVSGALLADVSPDGPAAKAGLERGDVITALNGEPIGDSRRLRLRIAELAPGTRVNVELVRDGARMTLPLTLGELKEDVTAGSDTAQSSADLSRGLSVQDLTAEIRQSLNLGSDVQGVVINGVEPGSAAAAVGLRRGDVIEEVNRKPVRTTSDLEQAFKSHGDDAVLLLVNRGGTTLFVVLPSARD